MSASFLQTALNALLNKLKSNDQGRRGMVAQTHFLQKFDIHLIWYYNSTLENHCTSNKL